MSESSTSATGPGKRGSILPRPGLSKLPAPGSAGTRPHILKSPTIVNGLAKPEDGSASTLKPTGTQRPPSYITPAHPRTNSQSGFAVPHRPIPSSQAPPSSYPRQALASAQARPGQHERQTSIASSTSSRSQYTRHNSLQSDYAPDGQSSEESEATAETPTSPMTSGSSLKLPKKSRPSLSDRTIDSLANVPPTPATDRRRSSFFNPQSPMSSQRPGLAAEKSHTVSRINYGVGKSHGIARPTSPANTKHSLHPAVGVPPRRNVSTSMPRPTSAASNIRPPSPVKKLQGPTASGSGKTTGRPRPMSLVGTPSSSVKSPTFAKPASQKFGGLSKPTPRKPIAAAKVNTLTPSRPDIPPASVQAMDNANQGRDAEFEAKPASSIALRQKIAQAKALARNARQTQQSLQSGSHSASYDFENHDDPFGMKPGDEVDQLRKRIDDARRDGRLNISAMNLSAIPDEVMRMYDAEAMESSSVPWNETVDLTRLIAADNDISELHDNVFPDISLADMADSEDSKGNQFGGLEHIDLHGNGILQMPMGLRQLSRLTSLNLSRNRLDNSIFNIVSMIPTLCDLNLSNNALAHDLPDLIGHLSLLQHLDVSSNKISCLPATLRNLTRLRTLSMSHNRIQSLPFDAFTKMTALRELSVSHNAISGALFPSSVSELPNLRTMDVSNNSLASLTFSRTVRLPSLIRLDISCNRLGLFKDVSGWISLTTLLADDNDLREFPQAMTTLTEKLRVVSLERNSITVVPEEVADMEALDTLNLAGNPIYERKLLTLDVHGIKRHMADKRELSKAMNAS